MSFSESAILKKVRALIARAEHPTTPPFEAEAAAAKAEELMMKYAVDEAVARMATNVTERAKPGVLEFDLGMDQGLATYIMAVANAIAAHLRCKVRHYVRHDSERGWISRAYGFDHDLRFFEVLYTTIRLHMIDALRPKWDPVLTNEENAYRLHNAGFNWLQMAELRGWHKRGWGDPNFDFEDTRYGKECWIGPGGELKTNWQLGSQHKRYYFKACEAKGESTKTIAAGGTETYRRSAAQGYASRINQRLHKLRHDTNSEPGAAVALRDAFQDVEDFFRAENPDLFQTRVREPEPECEKCKKNPSGHCRDHPRGRSYAPRPFSQAGYSAGTAVADTADLMGGDKVSKSARAVNS